MPQYQREIATKLTPLCDIFCERQAEMAVMLDTLHTTQKFTHDQQDKIAHLITSLCKELISQHGREDLKPLYDYYSEQSYDAAVQEDDEMASELLKSLFEQKFGVELNDDEFDFCDPEELAARLAKKAWEQQQQAQKSRRTRKKSAKLVAKEACEQEEEANLSKSIQSIYRQLVAALHPDREPNATERERKTELMQKVTVAYGKKDLLELLSCIEQIGQGKNNIADDLLKLYNKILQNQLQELKQEVMQMEQDIRKIIGLAPYERLSPKRLSVLLNEDVLRLRSQINRIQHDLMKFNDVKQFKTWLKSYRVPDSFF